MMKDEADFSAMIWALYVKFLASTPRSEILSHCFDCRVSADPHRSVSCLSCGMV